MFLYFFFYIVSCLGGWTSVGSSCYFFDEAQFMVNEDAMRYCINLGGYVATFKENFMIERLLETFPGIILAFVGASKRSNHQLNKYKWLAGGKLLSSFFKKFHKNLYHTASNIYHNKSITFIEYIYFDFVIWGCAGWPLLLEIKPNSRKCGELVKPPVKLM